METFSASVALCGGTIHLSPVDFPYKGQWREALMFSEQTIEQTIETAVIWDVIGLIMTSL